MKLILAIVLLSGCAHSVSDSFDSESEDQYPAIQRPAPSEEDYVEPKKLNPDACVPQKFASNNIPPDFKLDPSCPPEIYDPPQFILPGNIGPVIYSPSKP